DFKGWILQTTLALNLPRTAWICNPTRIPQVGYTGFVVRSDEDQVTYHVYHNALLLNIGVPGPQATIDEWLFDTNARRLYDEFGLERDILTTPLVPVRIRHMPSSECPTTALNCGHAAFPPHPNDWEGSDDACYNYANNSLTPFQVYPPSPHPRRQLWTPA